MTTRRRLLMIAYYFPPLGMGGVQRPLKFARYLPECGWDVTVVTTTPDRYHALDESLLSELPDTVDVVRVKSLDPASFVRRGKPTESRSSSQSTSGLMKHVQQWSRWPDAKIHFARVATREAIRLAKGQPFDAIYTTSPPPSVHFAGLRLQRKLNIPWIADFRDPWLVKVDDWGPTALHRRYAQHLRARILRRADHTLAMNEMVTSEFRAAAADTTISVIPNGYDEADFTDVAIGTDEDTRTIAFYGTASPETNVRGVLESAEAFNRQHPGQRVRVRHIGQIIGMAPISHPDFESTGYLPHLVAIRQLCAADVIALTLDSDPLLRMTIPGRTYEALRSLRPIIAIAPRESMLARTLASYDGVWCCEPGDIDSGVHALRSALALERTAPARVSSTLQPLDRRFQASQLAKILDRLVTHTHEDRGAR